MLATWSLIKREFAAYFLSPIAYAMLAFFLWILGGLFDQTFGLLTRPGTAGVEYPLQSILATPAFWLVFLLIPPLLTMRLLAEERGTGSLELLMTAPIRDWQVVAGKFIACFAFYVVLWLPTLIYLPILVNFDWGTWQARIDPRPVLTSYLGVMLAGAMFLAIGLFVSSLVKNQLVAAILALVISLVFILAAFVKVDAAPDSLTAKVVQFVSVPEHFRRDFTRGVVDTRAVVLYVSMTAFSLFLTVRSLEARRLR
jgi:ABC-2 type transport system permease protein